jgi:hypothetical protein
MHLTAKMRMPCIPWISMLLAPRGQYPELKVYIKVEPPIDEHSRVGPHVRALIGHDKVTFSLPLLSHSIAKERSCSSHQGISTISFLLWSLQAALRQILLNITREARMLS